VATQSRIPVVEDRSCQLGAQNQRTNRDRPRNQ
jgi:hypothetical protein